MSDEHKEVFPLWHQSGINRDGEPFIQLILGDKIIAQQSVEQAREHALAILEAAEAAEQDAFLVHFAKTEIGVGENEAAKLLMSFRDFRREQTGKRSGQEVIPQQKGKSA
jgi:hypothetical protein